ncbi:hypothetical protein CCHL11_06350 [Colletotrichum chlorophyti]|uniref:Uncharacterized protein n=1 Tax=Colletotrichum chlorophyti TaxID=708187 RepID=A0A1Q8RPU1_9PEZI|nr:hypothetical protein CCHL11_06350 [Colletotrichum chlorophyti]
MSFRPRDMLPTEGKLALYNKDNKYLCKKSPRFSLWRRILSAGVVPVFLPPLEYNRDEDGRQGAEKKPDDSFDTIPYDKEIFVEQGETPRGYRRSMGPQTERRSKRLGSNVNPEHIVITHIAGQTAKEICDDPNSMGYDIASYVDMKFCDLSERKLYYLCSDRITSNCFDVDNTVFRERAVKARGEKSATGPKKAYKSKDLWK